MHIIIWSQLSRTARKTARKITTTRRIVSSSTVETKKRIGQCLSLRCPQPPLPKTSWAKARSPSVRTANPHLSFIPQTRPPNPNCGPWPKLLRRIRGVTNRHRHQGRYRPPGHQRNAPFPPDTYTTHLLSTRVSRTMALSDIWTASVQTQRIWTELIRLCYTERETANWLWRCAKNSPSSTRGRIFSVSIYWKGFFSMTNSKWKAPIKSELYTKHKTFLYLKRKWYGNVLFLYISII